jgi:type VI protein secretion system component VasA
VGDEDDVIRASHGLEGEQQDEEQQDGKHAADGQLSLSRRRKRKRCHKMHKIEVSVTSSDQSLTMETRESYSLSIDGSSHAILIQANSVFGALRAMETLSQLVRRRSVQQVEGSSSELEGFVPDDALWPGASSSC